MEHKKTEEAGNLMKKAIILVWGILLAIVVIGLASAQPPTITVQSLSPQQAEKWEKLTPEQKKAVEEELSKTGGNLTPEALETLKYRPEFQGLSPEDILKGREILEQKQKQAPPAVMPPIVTPPVVKGVEPEKPLSLFERFRKLPKYQNIPLDLKPFGYDFFSTAAVRIITERKDIPVPLKYVVGPGDEVKILLWGRVNAQYNLVVDRDGKITIPQIGPVYVAGQTFEDMSKQIVQKAEQIVGTNVDVTMGALKTIPIFILGDVQRPGAYTIGSFATITDALLLAGGPTEIGSMRNIQLRRKGKLITTFDLYDLLLKGDKSKDVTLMEGDVVFVPVTGPLVGIAGNVKRPAIYELRDRHDLKTLIEMAGGLIPTAYTQQVQVERIVKGEKQILVDIDDKNLDKAASFKLEDADLVKIFPIVDTDMNAIQLSGNVKRPGKYEVKPGMRISNIIKSTEDLLPETYFDYALIKREKPPFREPVLIPFNLGDVLFKKSKDADVELMPRDQVFIFSKWFFEDKPYISVEGEIRGDCKAEQGATEEKKFDTATVGATLRTIEESLTKLGLFDLAAQAKDLQADLKTTNKITAEKLFNFRLDLQRAGQGDLAARILDIENRAKATCRVALVKNMTVRDALLASGGITTETYLEKAQIVRKDKTGRFHTLYFNVEKALNGDPANNLTLEKDDRVIIHSLYEYEYRKYVSIAGEVAKPGNYRYTEGMRVRDLVFNGGNILESAYLEEAEISSLVITERAEVKTKSRVINLRLALAGDPEHNIPLQPHDRLLVKRIPEWGNIQYVTISGEVRFPGRYAIHKGERLSSVIERAGGYLPTAYIRGAYFTRESVRQLQQKSLEEMANRMERELLGEDTARITTSLTSEELQAKMQAQQMKRKLIDYIRGLKATGRMTIALTHPRLFWGSFSDVELEDGDSLYIPRKNNVINVVGAVMSEGSHIYNEKWTYQDYIDAAGGFARYADTSNVFVLKVDGSARKLSEGLFSWNSRQARWELSGFEESGRWPKLEPGDVIVVPEKVTAIAWLREIRDITQILMNTAVTAATIIKLW